MRQVALVLCSIAVVLVSMLARVCFAEDSQMASATEKPSTAKRVRLGVPFSDLSIEHPSEGIPVLRLVEEGITARLFSVTQDDGRLYFKPQIASGLKWSSEHEVVVEIRVEPNSRGARLRPLGVSFIDLIDSLGNCSKLPNLTSVGELRIDTSDLLNGGLRFSFHISADLIKAGVRREEVLAELVKSCPITANTLQYPGAESGKCLRVLCPSSLSAQYRVARFTESRLIELIKNDSVPFSERLASTITFKGIGGESEALSKLRAGELDVIFLTQTNLIEQVLKDETLELLKCSIYSVALRKGTVMQCSGELTLNQIAAVVYK